jgi:hypothetical protein
MIKEAKENKVLRGFKVSDSKIVSDLLFGDDIFCSVNETHGNL